MKTYRLLALSLAVFITLSILSLLPAIRVLPQSNCPPTPAIYPGNTSQGTWRSGATIFVNIDPSFTQDQKDAIVAAIRSWNNANNSNGNNSGVHLQDPPTYSSQPLGSSFTQDNLQITNNTNISDAGNASWGGVSTPPA